MKKGKHDGSERKVKLMKSSSKPDVTDLIGQQLQKYYGEMADQPVPDRFLDLLDKLDEAIFIKEIK